jgi:hypothetical protein
MTDSGQRPFVKLQSGERLDAVSEGLLPEILENLHPEYNARATFHLSDQEWVSVLGCVSEGFAVSFKRLGQPDVAYCPKMLPVADVKRVLTSFLRGDPGWNAGLPWKLERRTINRLITVLVICVVVSIIVFFVFDLLEWW